MEIYGIGIDIIEISRIQKTLERTPRFKEKVYTKNERIYIEAKKTKYQSYAVRFAGKEAFSKALGTGIRGFQLTDIEILNNEYGKPYIILYNSLKKWAKEYEIKISLSHCKLYAVAEVLIYKK